ncbi:putative family 31 glucosidase KIAA1161-like protein, partial [Leptotrombidium deliense]
MTKTLSESGDYLMKIEDANGSQSEGDVSTPPQTPTPRRSSQLKGLERRGSEAKVLQLSVDNTWATVSPKNNTKLKASVEKMSAVVRRGWKPELWYKTFVGLFFVVIALLIGTTTFMYNRQSYLKAFRDKIYILEEKRNFFLLDAYGNELLKATFGVNVPGDIKPLNCFKINNEGELSHICREWQYRAHLNIDYQHKPNGISCYRVRWHSYDSLGIGLKDCFELENSFWYGMGLVEKLSWPLTNVSLQYSPFVTGGVPNPKAPFGSIIKRYWISSKGVSIRVPLNIPLYVSFNASDENGNFDNKLCLESRTNRHPYNLMSDSLPHLEYTICTGNNIIQLHTEVSKNWTKVLRTTKVIPKKDKKGKEVTKASENATVFLKEIFWTTNTELFPNVTQLGLQSYADKIMSYGFEPGIIVLDSRWECHTGDLSINRTTFQNPGALFNVLHFKGFKILMTVTPFIDISADILVSASNEKRVFLDRHINATLFTKCKESPKKLCALLDLMNSTTREWFHRRINNSVLTELNVDGLLFKGIPVTLMPLNHYNNKPNIVNPDYYQIHYKNLAKNTINLIGLDTAAGIHGLESFFQISPLTSSWTSLRSIIPQVLTLGLIGYAIINTGSVGGDLFVDPKTFDRELYIRWLELSA